MAKKSNKKSQPVADLQSNTTPLLELKYDAPLFALAAHPTKPIIASGLANGYVFLTEYDAAKLAIYQYDRKEVLETQAKLDEKNNAKKDQKAKKQKIWKVYLISKQTEDDDDGIKQIWKTKRHKGSVRSICFNAEGTEIYTVGSDNVIKRADSETGKVIKKTEIDSKVPITKIIKSQTHPFIITGDEVGNVRVFDINLKQINIIQHVHEDAINNIVQLVHKSAYQFLSVGSTTLSIWDIRKQEVKMTSENQEDEMLSCGFVDPTKGETLICGMGEGIVTIWKQSKNEFVDQLSRVKIAKDESIDSVISTMNNDECIWAGCSNGTISKVNAKRGQVIETRVHGSIDEVSFLDIDCEYRLISAGMDKLKLWNNDDEEDEDEEAEDLSEDLSDSDNDKDDDSDSDEDNEEDNEEEEFGGFSDDEDKEAGSDIWEDLGTASEEEEKEEESTPEPEPEVKKHKEEEEEAPKKKSKKQKLTPKQLRNQLSHEHGIRRFDDL